MDLEVSYESVLLLELRHLVSELGVDAPDGWVQLLHARSVHLVLGLRELLGNDLSLCHTFFYLTSNLLCSTLEGSGILVGFEF